MILCVNLNAAIDKTVVVPAFRLNAIQRPQQVVALPGGKGVNVARGLLRLGAQPVVTGWVGGFNGQFIAAGLQHEGIATALVEVPSESRTCLSILDPDQHTLTEIYERGDPVPVAQVDVFRELFRNNVARYDAVTLSGSLPPGVPNDFYAELLSIAHAAGVPALLDTSGEALRIGLEHGQPLLIKPNAHEFSDLLGRPVVDITAIAQAATELSTRYHTMLAVSLGADGLLLAYHNEVLHAHPPQLTIISAVGSGDCSLAGLAYGFTHGFTLRQMLEYAVAAGTANALSIGAGAFSMADFERVRAGVTVAAV